MKTQVETVTQHSPDPAALVGTAPAGQHSFAPLLGWAALVCGGFSDFIPTVFHWLAPWLVPWLSPAGKEFMLWLTLASAVIAMALGVVSQKTWQGKSGGRSVSST